MLVKQATISPDEALRRRMSKAKWTGCVLACILVFAGLLLFKREHLSYGVPISFFIVAFCMFAPEMVLGAFWDAYQSIVSHMPGGVDHQRSNR